MWIGLLVMFGLGALAYAIIKASQNFSSGAQNAGVSATAGLNDLAKRLEQEGLGALLPKSFTGGSNGESTGEAGYKNPAAWGGLIKGLTDAGVSIYKTASGGVATPMPKPTGSNWNDILSGDLAID